MSFIKSTPDVNSFDQLNSYLEDLEDRIFNAFKTGEFDSINLRPLATAPNKPRSGDIINANYEAVGIYYFDGSVYIKLG